MRRKFLLGILFLAIVGMSMSLPGVASADDLIVIGNRSVPVASLTPKDVKNIYLGKMKVWDNGMKIVFVTLGSGDTTNRFLKQYVKKNPSMFNKYWKKKVFTGGGKPPRSFSREKDLLEYVSKTKGAIGYVSSQAYKDNVKILSVIN